MTRLDTRLYWIWMQQALGAGNHKVNALLRELGQAQAVYEADEGTFAPFELTGEELKRLRDKSLGEARRIARQALSGGGWMLTPDDRLYPSLLRAIPSIPLVLYGRGEMPDLDILPSVAVVGTRETTGYGRRATALIAGGLALGGMVVVSGGARGVDAIAHQAALAAGGITIAVQACGLDVDYPKSNEELRQRIALSGAVLTEYPPGTQALKHHFPIRNRIISGLALGTCVTEAPERSGALITAHHAFEQGRDVYAVAGDMLTGRSGGTDEMIRQGARLVTGAEEILREYEQRFPDILEAKAAAHIRGDPRFRNLPAETAIKEITKRAAPGPSGRAASAVCPNDASDAARAVFSVMTETPRTLGQIIERADLPAPQVLTALTELEVCDCVQSFPGQMYALSRGERP